MTYENRPLSGAPQLPETLPPEPPHPFSQETIELVGQASLDHLLSLGARLEATRQDLSEIKLTASREVIIQGNLGRRIHNDPFQGQIDEEVNTAYTAWALLQLGPHTPTQLTTNSKIVIDLYRKYNHAFVPLSPEAIDEDIEHVKALKQHKLTDANRSIEELFLQYDNADNIALKRELLQRIHDRCVATSPVDMTGCALLEYLSAERVFSCLERLESKTSSSKLVEVFNLMGMDTQKVDIQGHAFARRPLSESSAQYQTAIKLLGGNPSPLQVQEQLILLCKQEHKKQAQTYLGELNQAALRILYDAEASLFSSIKAVAGDTSTFPYNLIDRYQANPLVLMSLGLLDLEQRLAPLRAELKAFTQSLEPGSWWQWNYEQLVEDLQAKMGTPTRAQSIEAARRTIGELLTQHLDTVLRDVQPLTDVVTGKKPRVPRNPKNIRPEHQAALTLHNELHRHGFEDQEKAAIVAITSEQWGTLKRLHAYASAEHTTTVDYAAEIGHCLQTDSLKQLKQMKDFSLNQLLANIHVKFTLSPKVLYGFGPYQKKLIDAALSDLHLDSPAS